MRTFKALMKREFWEHKGSIYYTPGIMAIVLAVLMTLGALTGDNITINDLQISMDNPGTEAVGYIEQLPEEKRDKVVQVILYSSSTVFGGVLLAISLFYALGCLYDERKDRSILFWKSLPISDTETVLSKYVAIVIMAPLFYFVATAMFQLFMMLFLTVGAWINGSSGGGIWGSSNLFMVLLNTLFSIVVASIWLSPIWAWCMLASSWAKKVVFLWAGLPVVMLIIAESWIFGTEHFRDMVGERIVVGFAIQNSYMSTFDGQGHSELSFTNATDAVSSGDFWLGLVVTAAFLGVAIYTRRFRDES